MDIYLDANATTPVLPQAQAAALAAMNDCFGNPSSTHTSGLRARALLERVRADARRVLGAPTGQLLFTSGATEGIHTAVLSALCDLREQRARGAQRGQASLLLHGATEHKAVPAALAHWNRILGLGLVLKAIPVGPDGHHDLDWLRRHAPEAALVCTMAANNETGVVSDLDGISAALADSRPLWLVDGVQALGKLPLRLLERGIDYAPFSGHKLYAPKGVGMLYVREGAPFTPLLTGGDQEGALRAGTENMSGIAALGAVLEALEDGQTFQAPTALRDRRERLIAALREAFPALVLNAPVEHGLPTTLNFAVPGLASKQLLDLFDAAGMRVSAGSACGAAKAQPSEVLLAMGLSEWQAASAVRLSIGAADPASAIDEACARIRACGDALRAGGAASASPERSLQAARPLADNVGLNAAQVQALMRASPRPLLVDVREASEQAVSGEAVLGPGFDCTRAPLSALSSHLPDWLGLPVDVPVLFFCRSGNRSAQAARALRDLGREQAWSLEGGLALWPVHAATRAPD
ncbi:aminotransferase class V-fold PLP-dependent enzyme [Hydrogenophaga sp.]|uniref:aminotransferase class V-fold PLP-dependent enzyme n=1 Tax=Hydrogenophaga sp. TaxID=1904254 RepID=UPI0026057005|nr:aminotransferase class V-fold PLP-dependent enzyme [Hydrogenophaga sp.]MCW5653982.1 aminotransferase class V-fold PLP-dependent enzyme [Hydrogenophaga sp.]